MDLGDGRAEGLWGEISTCFLERGRFLWAWRSQYFCSGATSLEHLHFFPSVLLHLHGSGSDPFAEYLNSTPPDDATTMHYLLILIQFIQAHIYAEKEKDCNYCCIGRELRRIRGAEGEQGWRPLCTCVSFSASPILEAVRS